MPFKYSQHNNPIIIILVKSNDTSTRSLQHAFGNLLVIITSRACYVPSSKEDKLAWSWLPIIASIPIHFGLFTKNQSQKSHFEAACRDVTTQPPTAIIVLLFEVPTLLQGKGFHRLIRNQNWFSKRDLSVVNIVIALNTNWPAIKYRGKFSPTPISKIWKNIVNNIWN